MSDRLRLLEWIMCLRTECVSVSNKRRRRFVERHPRHQSHGRAGKERHVRQPDDAYLQRGHDHPGRREGRGREAELKEARTAAMNRSMGLIGVALMSALFFASDALGESGSEHVTVLVTGALNSSKFSVPFGSTSTSNLDVTKKIQPGIEVVFKPRSRVSFGVSYTKLGFGNKQLERGSFLDNTGSEYGYFETTQSAKLNALTGNVYLNFARESRVRPFVGGGVGIGQENITWTHAFRFPTGRYPDSVERDSLKSKVGVIKAVAGFDTPLYKRLCLRVSGGYQNGGYGAVGIGFGF